MNIRRFIRKIKYYLTIKKEVIYNNKPLTPEAAKYFMDNDIIGDVYISNKMGMLQLFVNKTKKIKETDEV